MSSPAQSDSDMYADDSAHPIPSVDHLDVMAVKKAGGATLTIVIATPLEGDRRSLERLMRKIENYLAYIGSDEYRRECGDPKPSNTDLAVVIDSRSSPLAFDLLEKCKPWVLANKATLLIEKRSGSGPAGR